jgi:hypothetical protein
MVWNRQLWGVELIRSLKEDKPVILGKAWDRTRSEDTPYKGEPTRALLFCTRSEAREWCRNKQADTAHMRWRFVPIKVREIVEKVPNVI